jgi:hypothetical protein
VIERGGAETAANDDLPSKLLESESDSINPNPDEKQPQEPDAERRKMYVNTSLIDQWQSVKLTEL